MKRIDIPGTFRLEHIRAAVRAVVEGADTSAAVGAQTGISSRHVSFAVHSARLLGWLEADPKQWAATTDGLELLGTAPGSSAEASAFGRAIARSAVVKRLAPDLLKPAAPAFEKLTKRIAKTTGHSEASASRGARVLLSWRRQALGSDDEGAPPVSAAVEPKAPSATADIRLTSLWLESFGPFKKARVELGPLTIIVGPLASGKSALVESLSLVAEALHLGVQGAVQRRDVPLQEILFRGRGDAFGIALELRLPEATRPEPALTTARYELVIGQTRGANLGVHSEALYFKPDAGRTKTLLTPPGTLPKGWRRSLGRALGEPVTCSAERGDATLTFDLDSQRLALSAVPDDVKRYGATLAVRRHLWQGFERLSLHPSFARRPCSPLTSGYLARDGSNIALVLKRLIKDDPRGFARWVEVVRRALPRVRDVRVVERKSDRHLTVVLDHDDMSVQASRLSDGTLRCLMLSLLPFGGDPGALILADEPSVAVAPKALAAVYESWVDAAAGGLDKARGPQLIVLTYSPLWAAIAPLDQLLCVDRGAEGEALITSGQKHSRLKRWRQKVKAQTLIGQFPLG